MSINDITLPAALTADLYQNVLVSDEKVLLHNTSQETKEFAGANTTADKNLKYLGDNKKNVLIVVTNAEAVHLTDNELNFLTGILTACKLTLADVAIFNRDNHPDAGYEILTKELKPRNIILFDVAPVLFDLPMNFPHYQVQPYNNVTYLYAPALAALENDKAEKMKLWTSLKRIFDI